MGKVRSANICRSRPTSSHGVEYEARGDSAAEETQQEEETVNKQIRLAAAVAILLAVLAPVVVAQGPAPLTNDVFPGWGTNSEYLIGDVAVGLILTESNGDVDTETENWSPTRIQQVRDEVADGLAWWAAREPDANVTFVVDYSLQATGYEPINRDADDRALWIEEILLNMGYTSSPISPYRLVNAYNNYLKSHYDTDWAFTIFVVDSYVDVDGKFTCGHFAFAARGGPYLVMTYDNGNYWIGWMDQVCAHEVGHIFHALDQYYNAEAWCYYTSGVLDIPNWNSAGCPWPTGPSIMKFTPVAYPAGIVDRYARGQIGWWDANCNGVLDPVDPDIETDFCFYVWIPLLMRGY